MQVIGWKLDKADRVDLLKRFPPQWPDVIADHITLEAGVPSDAELPSARTAEVIGIANDGQGLEALVVALDGSPDRPDGGIFHITWSLDRKRAREPAESNDLIAQAGWKSVPPVRVRIAPARF